MKTIKRLAACLALILALYGGTAARAEDGRATFKDIKGSFAEASVSRLAGLGIIDAAGEEFRPGDSISRLEFAVMLAKSLGIQPVYPEVSSFSDVLPGTPEAGYLEALAGAGVIKGQGGSFSGSQPLLRQDAAVMIHQSMGGAYERTSLNDRYADRETISPYAAGSVAYVTGKSIMGGSGGSFYPLRELTRAEAAVLAARLLDIRKGQALTAIPVISPRQLSLGEGAASKLEIGGPEQFPSFTPVFGTDSPEVCLVSPEGVVQGKRQGNGTITVNKGLNSYVVKTGVLSSRSSSENSSSVTGEVYQASPVPDMTYTIKQQSPDTAFQETEKNGHPGPPEGLASNSDTWTGFLRQQGRDITVDLKTVRPVTEISMEFMQNAGWGVFLPGYMKGEVSVDGVTWYHLGYVYHGVSPSDPDERLANLTISFTPVNARYVRVSFPVDIWVFARRLSVKEMPAAARPAVLACAGEEGGQTGNYMQVPNINDILLVYTGNKSDTQTLTLADFLPLVGYQDSNRNISGRMFDSMLFLPYYDMPVTRDGWAAYMDDLFSPGRQLAALDEAVARMNSLTGLAVREKVILGIPYPDVAQQDFGALREGEESLDFSEQSAGREQSARDRLAAVQWYYREIMSRWSGAGFKNLDLSGLYWYGESIENTNGGEKELVQGTARLVRDGGQNFFWIPYFGTKGYENWRSYGFSHVFLQPNYFAQDSPPEDRMDRAAQTARDYGMGIEMELDENVLYDKNYYDLFVRELQKGHQLGFDGGMTNAWYAGNVKKTLVQAARSDAPETRALYDDIYRWINGMYQ